MQNLNKLSKTILYLLIISFVIFFGSYIVKLSMLNQFFEPENMQLKQFFIDKDLSVALTMVTPIFIITLASFTAFTILFLIFIPLSRINLKNNGWLFIIFFIFLITGIFEWILVVQFDVNILLEITKVEFNQEMVTNLFQKRLTEFGPFPLILVFSYLIIIYLAVFKPLQKKI